MDLGAGTGVGTQKLAGCTPAQIVAIEPSLTMRSALLTRVVDSPVLRKRLSGLAGRVPEALDQLPPMDGFVCAHMLGHLAPADRAATFARLADLLAPNGRGVVVVNSTSTSTASVSEERQIGQYRYLARHLPSGESSGYVSEYQVLDGDTMLRSETSPIRGKRSPSTRWPPSWRQQDSPSRPTSTASASSAIIRPEPAAPTQRPVMSRHRSALPSSGGEAPRGRAAGDLHSVAHATRVFMIVAYTAYTVSSAGSAAVRLPA